MVTSYGFDAQWSPLTLPGNSGNTIVTPSVCRTTTHTAGANEFAIVNVHATATPQNAASDVLYINVMISTNGGNSFAVQSTDSAESMSDGTANASASKRIPLTQNMNYIFGAGLASNGSVAIGTGYCQGTVLIIKQ